MTATSSNDFQKIIHCMVEQEEKRCKAMMDMIVAMQKTFDYFAHSMTNLTNYLLANSNQSVLPVSNNYSQTTPALLPSPISVKDMIADSKSNYTNYGKKYRAEVIELCQKIVSLSEFEYKKAVLASCYRHLTKKLWYLLGTGN